jgi:hypothetical protein
VSKTGYISADETIAVLNHEETVFDGYYIYGTVLNKLCEPIENAKICIIVSENNGLSYKCVFTDCNGGYLILISEGAYNIEVSKNRYLKYSLPGATVNLMLGTNIDFELEIDQSTVKPSKSLLDYTIDEEIKKGSIIGVVDVSDQEEQVLTFTVEKGVTKYILIINNAHYSEHEIVISLEQIVETLGGTTAILYYVSFLIIVAVLFVGVGTIRRPF